MEFAFISSSKKVSTAELEYAIAAVNVQIAEFCAAYGRDPIPAVLYASIDGLPAGDIWIFHVVDTPSDPGALGWHSAIGDRPYGEILAQENGQTSVTISHEVLETLGDETCDRWSKRPDGTEVAVEVADPVEGDSYPEIGVVGNVGQTVELSNYVFASWFDPNGKAPFDRMGRLTAPFAMTPGGYMVVLGNDGNESEVFACVEHGGAAGEANAGRKLAKPNGRLLRRLRRKR